MNANGPILGIWARLRSSNHEALAPYKIRFLNDDRYKEWALWLRFGRYFSDKKLSKALKQNEQALLKYIIEDQSQTCSQSLKSLATHIKHYITKQENLPELKKYQGLVQDIMMNLYKSWPKKYEERGVINKSAPAFVYLVALQYWKQKYALQNVQSGAITQSHFPIEHLKKSLDTLSVIQEYQSQQVALYKSLFNSLPADWKEAARKKHLISDQVKQKKKKKKKKKQANIESALKENPASSAISAPASPPRDPGLAAPVVDRVEILKKKHLPKYHSRVGRWWEITPHHPIPFGGYKKYSPRDQELRRKWHAFAPSVDLLIEDPTYVKVVHDVDRIHRYAIAEMKHWSGDVERGYIEWTEDRQYAHLFHRFFNIRTNDEFMKFASQHVFTKADVSVPEDDHTEHTILRSKDTISYHPLFETYAFQDQVNELTLTVFPLPELGAA